VLAFTGIDAREVREGGVPHGAGQVRGAVEGVVVEEDGDDAAERRVAVIVCSEGVLLADGDVVHASVQDAVEAVGAHGAEGALVVVTSGLRDAFPHAVAVDGSGLREAAAEVDMVAAVRRGGVSGKQVAWMAACTAVGVVGILAWANWTAIGIRFGWVEEKKERPRVVVSVESGRFLALCRDEIGRRELGLAGFDRIAVVCHAQYAPEEAVGAPWSLSGRPVLEVRWRLRKPLSPRVYVGLAEAGLDSWFWAGVHDNGDAVGVVPLPQVLTELGGVAGQSHPAFRARIDALLALRGFRIEYPRETGMEVVLETERPLSEAVALVSELEGLEVVSVAFENGRWRFEGRRRSTKIMFEDEFVKLTAPLARAVPVMDEAGPKGVA